MNYQQSREYIRDAEKYAGELGLTNIQRLMHRLGDPQDSLKFVHVAGTNGKGSVIAYTYTTLMGAGYRVGRYISPSVYHYREKMEVNGSCVTREEFASYVARIAEVIDTMTREGLAHPTPFEIETAAAFLFFAEKNCDLVVLEVGMGGRDDATNLIRNTLAAVLVPISLEHQEWLGKTLAEIAEKKAGIIKPGCEVITSAQEDEALRVIREKANKEKAALTVADPKEVKLLHEDIYGQKFLYKGEEYEISLAGVYQTQNAVTALETLSALEKHGFPLTQKQKFDGIKNTRWDGRLTILQENPLFLIDGAHNPAAAKVLEESVKRYLKEKKLYFIMGVFADKDYENLIRRMCPYAQKIFAIETPDNPRALAAEKLAQAIRPVNPNVEAMPNIEEAVRQAFAAAEEEDAILAFGSLSFLGEITKYVKKEGK